MMMEAIQSRVTLPIVALSVSSIVAILLVQLWIRSLHHSQQVVAFRYQGFVFVEFIMFLLCRYIWKRMSVLPRPSRAPLLLVMILGMARFGMNPFTQTDPNIIVYLTSMSMATVILLSSVLGICDVIMYVVISRDKEYYSKIKAWLCLVIVTMLLIIERHIAEDIKITRLDIPVNDHISQDGLTIAQLSDIHLGPNVGRTKLTSVVEMTNQLQPDAVVITGDLIDAPFEYLQYAVQPLAGLNSKLGVYFITGNHEYYTGDIDRWLLKLLDYGVKPLVNSRVKLLPDLYLAGLEDYQTKKMNYGNHIMDVHAALAGRDRGIPTIVLAHQPNAVLEAMYWEDVFLVLSGHTHAGQLYPIALPVYLMQPFFAGLYEPLPGVYVYVSAGTVYNWMPLRDFYRPEIVLYTLTNSNT